jgi:tetratricopeptide (TPR) repeat protein
VVRAGGGYQGKTDRFVDVRVDDHAEPVAELERIYELWEERFLVYTYLESGRESDLAYALPIMDRVLGANPDDADYYNNFAWHLASSKRMPAKAVELALLAHELAPDDANIMDTVAEAHYAAGDYEQAIAWEKKAIAADPQNEFFAEQLKKFEDAAAP